jgi:hypothetical protein
VIASTTTFFLIVYYLQRNLIQMFLSPALSKFFFYCLLTNQSVNGIVDLDKRAKVKRQMSRTLQYTILDGQFVVYMPFYVSI